MLEKQFAAKKSPLDVERGLARDMQDH